MVNNPEVSNISEVNSPNVSVPPRSSSSCTLRRIFVGKNGIRAGWGALIFFAAFFTLDSGGVAILGRFISLDTTKAIPLKLAFLQESCELLVVFAVTLLMARIEKRGFLSYGFVGDHKAVRFIGGIASGFICLSLLVGILWRTGFLAFDGFSITGLAALKYAFAWGLVFLLVGLFEESMLRGYLQFTLARGIRFWPAAVLLSVVFALGHVGNNDESLLGLVVVGIGGMVYCTSLWFTKSLWWAIGFHAGWDWAQSFFYGTPNSGLVTQNHLLASHPLGNRLWSGGLDGPEGSLLILPLLILVAISMWLWWGLRKKFVA